MDTFTHTPVLVDQFLAFMKPGQDGRLLDGTLGLGGHTKAFLQNFPNSTAVGIELDEQALLTAKENLQAVGRRVTFVLGSYGATKELIAQGKMSVPPQFTHIVLDLGIGSHQLADASRGFSFQQDGALTMRYGQAYALPASQVDALNNLEHRLGFPPDVKDIIAGLKADELKKVIWTYGEERYAGRIARAITEAGQTVNTGQQLADVIAGAVPKQYVHGHIHPATRTFQALRLAVNRELEVLAKALPELVELLAPKGKLAVISFHSLEDRIVKQFMRKESKNCICPPMQIVCICGHKSSLQILTKRPVTAGEDEVKNNPRARSAKMRVAQKTG